MAENHRFRKMKVALNKDEDRDRMIVSFDNAAPSLQRQAYGTGRGKDVIIEYVSDGKWMSEAWNDAASDEDLGIDRVTLDRLGFRRT